MFEVILRRMCSLFSIQTSSREIEEAFEKFFPGFPDVIDRRVTPHGVAPAFIYLDGKYISLEMNFSLVPSWSKERRPKFATHNARLFSEDGKTTIFEKATWKKPFLKNHCVIPISKFTEPIYNGDYAGNMVNFFGQELLFAAGIHDNWINKETGELLDSFAIITDDPMEFIQTIGHDRTPLFLTAPAALEWMRLDIGPQDMIEFLRENRFHPEKWNVEIERPLKDGWQKRK